MRTKLYFNATFLEAGRMKTQLLFALLFGLSSLTFAAGPSTPAPGEDAVLFGGKSAREFFTAREGQTDCRANLEQTRKTYLDAKAALKELVLKKAPAPEINAQEDAMESNRNAFLKVADTCGECATQKLNSFPEHRHWSATDGSCYLPTSSEIDAESAYEKAKAVLTAHSNNYARYTGGFPAILDCFPVDSSGGRLAPGPLPSPFRAFIAVEGPLLWAFNYISNTQYEEKQTGDLKEFFLTFNGTEAPEALQNEIYYVAASGEKTKKSSYALKDVRGMWYLTNKGYYRYYTAADFRTSFTSEKFALNTLLKTLLDITERSTTE